MSCSCLACKAVDSVTPHRGSRRLSLTFRGRLALACPPLPASHYRVCLVRVVEIPQWEGAVR